jgi:hypothetical protein
MSGAQLFVIIIYIFSFLSETAHLRREEHHQPGRENEPTVQVSSALLQQVEAEATEFVLFPTSSIR